MRLLIALKNINSQKGFSLLEVLVVTILLGIMATIAIPNFLGQKRQQEANIAFTQLKSALLEAQANAIRISDDCDVTITQNNNTNEYTINGSPIFVDHDDNPDTDEIISNCVPSSATIDGKAVSISTSKAAGLPQTISFNFQGETANMQTFWIERNDFSGNPIQDTGKCIVLSNALGMIRTGAYVAGGNCENLENKRYDNGF